MEEKEELMRLEKRREERKLKKEKKEAEIQQEKEELERGIDPNVMEMMGISGFGGTKKK